MICFFCFRKVFGADWNARYEWRTDPVTRETRVYGKGALPLSGVRGSIVKVAHNKCYHAHLKQQAIAQAKAEAEAADPSAQPGPAQDWRHQETVEVGELTGEGNRDHRGAGAAG